jgi:chromosomal replication initiation ATPase DnaA
MNMHTTNELTAELTTHYSDIRRKLMGIAPRKGIPSPVAAKKADDSELVASLQRDKVSLEAELNDARRSLRYVAEKEKMHRETERRLEKLELDLSDARARILSQADMMKALDDKDNPGGEVVDKRRSVPEIIAEVLKKYPNVTWDDVKGVRRTRDLIEPRHACMRAVYEERKDLSLPRIGKIFHKDHTSILSAVRKTPSSSV